MSHDVFICHSSKDRTIANAICAKLEQNRIRCWIAPRDVVPGSEYAQSIMEGLQDCKLTILVFSANSNNSAHVHKEIERSVNHGRPILPFRVEDVVPSPALEYFISDAHWLDALTPPLEKHLDYLVGTVRLLLDREAGSAGAEQAVLPAPVAPRTPSRGRRRLWWIGGAAAAVVAAVAVGLLVTRGGGKDDAAPGSGPTAGQTVPTAFRDEFTSAVDPSWTWVNEDRAAWKITPDGWLEVRTEDAPPFHNLLLRDAPKGSYSVKIRLRFPLGADGFAGLVFTGKDPNSRLQFGWSADTLVATEYKDGSVVADSRMRASDLKMTASRDAQLVLEVKDGLYKAQYYNATDDNYWDMGTARLDPSFTRVGLLVYSQAGASATAGFDAIEIY